MTNLKSKTAEHSNLLQKETIMPALVTEEQYNKASEQYLGWCTNCKDFTREQTEPDAKGYECPVCTEHTVMGAENALMSDEFDFSDETMEEE